MMCQNIRTKHLVVNVEDYEKAKQVCSDSQLYKQAGNGVMVNVVYEIAKKLN